MAHQKIVQALAGIVGMDFYQPYSHWGCFWTAGLARFAPYNVFHLRNKVIG
ncbi:hypothetical protein [Comamonas odontotermitis]|uniref:hypothetical protein n=1 Tax=Comamonas odontotermitis TaxID=379895 RepID=UPI001C8705A3|nr:hypothetical protein [Comamonas odontotermitis]